MNAPHRLWSLWEMYKFYAHDFVEMSSELGALLGAGEVAKKFKPNAINATDYPQRLRNEMPAAVNELEKKLEACDLNVSVGFLRFVRDAAQDGKPLSALLDALSASALQKCRLRLNRRLLLDPRLA